MKERMAKLTREEEADYFRRIKAGDKLAQDTFILRNQGLVKTIAVRYASRAKLSLADLIQEGNIGLMEAMEGFDSQKGCKFSTYALPWIRQKILRAIAQKSNTIRVPVNLFDLINRMEKQKQQFWLKYGRWPKVPELAELLKIPVEKVIHLLAAQKNQELLSLNFSVQHEEDGEFDGSFGEFLVNGSADNPEEIALANVEKEAMEKSFLSAGLTPDEMRVVCARVFTDNPKTLREVNIGRHVSRERIRQIERKGLAKLRESLSDLDLFEV